MKSYDKAPTTFPQQVELLRSRGLIIPDSAAAEIFLRQTNYYRFSAYCLPFETVRHSFTAGVHFSDVQALYEFDRKLRALVDYALETVEIIIRARAAYHLAHVYGAFAQEDKNNFYFDEPSYATWIEKIRTETDRSREVFIGHYKRTYSEYPALPIWVVMEIMSFGSLIRLINNMYKKDAIAIAQSFGIHDRIFRSCLLSFSYVRNICAHHSRLAGKNLRVRLELPGHEEWVESADKRYIGAIILSLAYFMRSAEVEKDALARWQDDVERLLVSQINGLDITALLGLEKGLPHIPGWRNEKHELFGNS